MKHLILLTTLSVIFTSCNPNQMKGYKSQINSIPTTSEDPLTIPDSREDVDSPDTDEAQAYEQIDFDDDIFPEPTPSSANAPQANATSPAKPPSAAPTGPNTNNSTQIKPTSPPSQQPVDQPAAPQAPIQTTPSDSTPVAKPTPAKPTAPTVATTGAAPGPSTFIKNAEWVMIKEGKKIGTPCNFYLRRVLEVSGFTKDSFLANDFDLYAKKHFRKYIDLDFKNDKTASEKVRLKKHIWSYPQRTPFIFQWSRSGVRGHVSIVERIGHNLIVYQASINVHTARRDSTSIDKLLNGFNRRKLTVYSEFSR